MPEKADCYKIIRKLLCQRGSFYFVERRFMMEFKYDEKTSATVLSVPLVLCFFDYPEELTGFERETIKGETTINRSVPNQYGTKYVSTPKPEFALIKEDQSVFTNNEQQIINRWLTSPQLPKYLEFKKPDNEITIYRGTFTDVRFKPAFNPIGAICQFEYDSPYAWKSQEKHFTTAGTYTIYVNSDETEKYVYPILTVKTETTTDIIVKNVTDNENSMNIHAYAKLPMTFDCKLCIPTDDTKQGAISYKDLGWEDVGNIYWLRLLPGENVIQITGDADVKITYKCPQKMVGGFLC